MSNILDDLAKAQNAVKDRANELLNIFSEVDKDNLFSSNLLNDGEATLEYYTTVKYVPNGHFYDNVLDHHCKFIVSYNDRYDDLDEKVSFDIPYTMVSGEDWSEKAIKEWFTSYMDECNDLDKFRDFRQLAFDMAGIEFDLLEKLFDYIKGYSTTQWPRCIDYNELSRFADDTFEENLGYKVNKLIQQPFVG